MDSPSHNGDNGSIVAATPDEVFHLRGYQAEMVAESMKANIIVVMDTGSGKTHIAIERARAELETCKPDKLVWFLAPTVALCEQQYEVFQANLPGYSHLLLCGRDVELWTTQSAWNEVFQHNVRIVISTHQILLDALTHGFMSLQKLALLIFDEAHHCTLKHPAHKIMSDFYMPQRSDSNFALPKVLGLSASPVMRAAANKQGLEVIERNLQATVRTPKLYRSELLRSVHRPELIQVNYNRERSTGSLSMLLLALKNAYMNYDLMQDPYLIALLEQQRNGYNVSRQLQKLWDSQRTYCYDQLKQLVSKAEAMAQELGNSAMEHYVYQCVNDFKNLAHVQSCDLSTDERRHLLNIFERLPTQHTTGISSSILESLSHKVNVLIDIIVAEAVTNSNFTGLVFVEQRVWVASLAEILASHPRTKALLHVGTFVGTSQSSQHKSSVFDYANPKNQQTVLDDFKAGIINLVLATSVLEEGIDIPSCHLVVCFEAPKTLKGFVQRRGRARQQRSRYYILVPDMGYAYTPASWQSLEAQMRKAYEDDKRQTALSSEKESIEEYDLRCLRIETTGALLTLDNAMQHLYHFCARLSSGTYVDARPHFDFTNIDGRVSAKASLPISVDPTVRTANSSRTWKTERMAQKDAAFEAYKTLYTAGLVNEHLLPVIEEDGTHMAQYQTRDSQPSLIPVSHTIDPWQVIAQYQQIALSEWHSTLLEVTANEESLRMILLTPSLVPVMQGVLLHWNETKRYNVKSSPLNSVTLDDSELQLLRSITWKMLHSIFGVHMKEDTCDFVYLLTPCTKLGGVMSTAELREWEEMIGSQQSAMDLVLHGNVDLKRWGLVKQQGDMRPFIARTISLPTASLDFQNVQEISIEAVRFPKRRDFLHPVFGSGNKNEAYTRTESLAITSCIVDNLPASYAILASLFPSITHKLETYMVANTLRTTVLQSVDIGISHLPVILLALTPSAVDGEENYQRLEFLGDCILKFITSLHLMATHPRMPEGILTGKKGKLVSNGYLARAALARGLDGFILYKRFTGAKWKPRYVSQVLAITNPPAKQEKSSKLIADVIESLIGASYVIGGFSKAFACVKALLPSEDWMSIPEANDTLYNAAPKHDSIVGVVLVEKLVGHAFNNKALLLEALTHPTFRGLNTYCSYEREEFLGDAVLDYIVSKRLYSHKPELPHYKMHGIRTAMVNASFLAYSMFETTVEEVFTNKETLQPEAHQRALWQFLRSTSHELVMSRNLAIKRHSEARIQIAEAIQHDTRFPWHALSLTDPPKFLSDIVESMIGALYIDSHGCLPVCEEFVQRLGILQCLERILHDGVDCLHPKERLGILAVDKEVKYVRVVSNGEGEGDEKSGVHEVGYQVQVRVGGKDVGRVVKGVKRLQAETIAAWKAIAILEGAGDGDDILDEEGQKEEEEFFDAEEGGGVMLDLK
ncbi:hypothetical protein COCCADRAFT_9637 [Bipolaris zeicola 26-R-13]|uniref:Dicer-like protein 2 n=1 Tax=Cochliobolus carbonum (strain 26-R-13) TaxID=930089 RepID=W6XKZ2_COCC2|nr:uncharacterized protein COCCADRAFT_9637 [Bipolaris zeicola 26-R-13]EUC27892.1 hypothetical protein COCCADRAFT_9637 [Bipolaris zeicola 26-R-13]